MNEIESKRELFPSVREYLRETHEIQTVINEFNVLAAIW